MSRGASSLFRYRPRLARASLSRRAPYAARLALYAAVSAAAWAWPPFGLASCAIACLALFLDAGLRPGPWLASLGPAAWVIVLAPAIAELGSEAAGALAGAAGSAAGALSVPAGATAGAPAASGPAGGRLDPGALVEALGRSASVLALFAASHWFAATTSAFEVRRGIERLLRPLGKKAAARVSLSVGLALAFIPWTLDDVARIREAASLRGLDPRRSPFRALLALTTPLLVRVLEKARRTGEAIELRDR